MQYAAQVSNETKYYCSSRDGLLVYRDLQCHGPTPCSTVKSFSHIHQTYLRHVLDIILVLFHGGMRIVDCHNSTDLNFDLCPDVHHPRAPVWRTISNQSIVKMSGMNTTRSILYSKATYFDAALYIARTLILWQQSIIVLFCNAMLFPERVVCRFCSNNPLF